MCTDDINDNIFAKEIPVLFDLFLTIILKNILSQYPYP